MAYYGIICLIGQIIVADTISPLPLWDLESPIYNGIGLDITACGHQLDYLVCLGN